MKKNDKNWPPPFKYPTWEVVEVTEGSKTWYEVHGGMLMVSDGFEAKKFRGLERAKKERDKRNNESDVRTSRVERIIP